MTNTNKSVRPTKIGRAKAAEMILNSKGRFFNVTFIKGDETERNMTCRKGVTKDIKANPKRAAVNVAPLGLIRVYDMIGKAWRMVNLQTVTALKMAGTTYKVG